MNKYILYFFGMVIIFGMCDVFFCKLLKCLFRYYKVLVSIMVYCFILLFKYVVGNLVWYFLNILYILLNKVFLVEINNEE